MEFTEWLSETTASSPKMEAIVSILRPHFTDNGFNVDEFDKSILEKLLALEDNAMQSLTISPNAQDQKI
jgi:hypothetical protein